MKRRLLVVIVLFAAFYTAHARLRDSESDLVSRYGQPIQQENNPNFANAKILTFKKSPFIITCYTINGVVQWMYYYKKTFMSQEQIEQLLQLNCPDSNWSCRGTDSYGITSWRNDRGDIAEHQFSIYDYGGCFSLGLRTDALTRETERRDTERHKSQMQEQLQEIDGL